MLGVHHELAVWTRPEDPADEEAKQVKERLRETLIAFTDPYAEPRLPFSYEVLIHRGTRSDRIIASNDVFGLADLHELEHYIDGEFDENGIFRGRVVAFGRDLGIKEHVPVRPPPRTGRDRLGPFSFCVGTFEQEAKNTTHSLQQLELLYQKAEKFGGVLVFRDGLRVMPYGRPDADFFEIEERRSRHAGRYFWAHRRSFGRVAFARKNNPNLRDKAGREGLVENRSNRELRILVKALLVRFAFLYFGTDSNIRQEVLPGIQARYAAAREAADRARMRRRKNVRAFLREQREPLQNALRSAEELIGLAQKARVGRDPATATIVATGYRDLLAVKDNLRPPPVPAKLGDSEERYREYRDGFRELTARMEGLARAASEIEADVGSLSPAEVARRGFNSHQSALNARVDRYLRSIEGKLDALRATWRGKATDDRGAYYKACRPLIDDEVEPGGLKRLLNLLEVYRFDLEEGFAGRYEGFLRTLEQLEEGIDLEGAFAIVEDDRTALEDRIQDLNAVAQVGITVEIVGHELETLDAEVRRNLLRLPEDVRKSSAFKQAFEAHSALTERLRFLSPLKVAGYRSRETITGAQIAGYVEEFFGRAFRDSRIAFAASDAFRAIRIVDLPSRIYPVFINLVNNAIYWVSQTADRRVALDFREGLVIVADSGRGIDEDDVQRLFELFFSRRREGRGVGLYLSRVNLAVANHKIWYAGPEDPKVLPGANFIIEFRGISANA